jgi:transposase-like protein
MPSHDTEVAPRARHRIFSADYKARILEEYDRATPQEKSAILRREGLYTSHIAMWRKLHSTGDLVAPRRGRRKQEPAADELERLRRENAKLQRRLAKAEQIIEVQGKVSKLLQGVVGESTDEVDNASSTKA